MIHFHVIKNDFRCLQLVHKRSQCCSETIFNEQLRCRLTTRIARNVLPKWHGFCSKTRRVSRKSSRKVAHSIYANAENSALESIQKQDLYSMFRTLYFRSRWPWGGWGPMARRTFFVVMGLRSSY